MNRDNQKAIFDRAAAIVLQHFTYEVIARKWNQGELGKPAKAVTMKRWLSTSPVDSKNSRFEVFIIGLASTFA